MSLTFHHTRENLDMQVLQFCLLVSLPSVLPVPCYTSLFTRLLKFHLQHQLHSPFRPNMWSGFSLCGPGILPWTQSHFDSICSQNVLGNPSLQFQYQISCLGNLPSSHCWSCHSLAGSDTKLLSPGPKLTLLHSDLGLEACTPLCHFCFITWRHDRFCQ